jgi:hypothetical protein
VNDESSRLNLAAVVAWEESQPGAGRDALLALPGMTDEIAAALQDWMDADDETRPGGAESDYYAELDPPYAPRNAIPETIEELLLIKGVTRGLLFGADANRDGSIDEIEAARMAELPNDSTSGAQRENEGGEQQALAWADLVTLYSAERNRSATGIPRIWLNSTDLGQLHAQLSRNLDQELADFIVVYRQFGPAAAGVPSASGASPGSPAPSGSETVPGSAGATVVDLARPASHTIASPLDLVDASLNMPAEGTTRTVPSPLESTDPAWKDRFDRLLDVTTMHDADVIVGRIHIDLAPLEVLAGVPGMDPELARQIVERRNQMTSMASESDAPRQPTWLLYENLVEHAQMRALLPYLTTGGDVVRCQIAGKLAADRVAERAEVVIDGTRSPTVQLYWRDLRVLGPAFALETLGLADDREASSSDSPPQSTAGAQAPL